MPKEDYIIRFLLGPAKGLFSGAIIVSRSGQNPNLRSFFQIGFEMRRFKNPQFESGLVHGKKWFRTTSSGSLWWLKNGILFVAFLPPKHRNPQTLTVYWSWTLPPTTLATSLISGEGLPRKTGQRGSGWFLCILFLALIRWFVHLNTSLWLLGMISFVKNPWFILLLLKNDRAYSLLGPSKKRPTNPEIFNTLGKLPSDSTHSMAPRNGSSYAMPRIHIGRFLADDFHVGFLLGSCVGVVVLGFCGSFWTDFHHVLILNQPVFKVKTPALNGLGICLCFIQTINCFSNCPCFYTPNGNGQLKKRSRCAATRKNKGRTQSNAWLENIALKNAWKTPHAPKKHM